MLERGEGENKTKMKIKTFSAMIDDESPAKLGGGEDKTLHMSKPGPMITC